MKKNGILLATAILILAMAVTGCSGSGGSEGSGGSGGQQQEAPKEPETPTFAVGDVLSNENKEITINNVEFSHDVLPDDTSGFYSHYTPESGNVYIHIDVDVKNLEKQDLRCDDVMKVKVDYNEGYEYSGSPVVEDSMTGFTYANITSIKPLETTGMRFLVECPQEVEESENPVKIILDIDGDKYEYQMR